MTKGQQVLDLLSKHYEEGTIVTKQEVTDLCLKHLGFDSKWKSGNLSRGVRNRLTVDGSGKGTWRIPSNTVSVVKPNIDVTPDSVKPNTPKPDVKKPDTSMGFIPEVDKDYVKFGHHKDIEKIIKSGIFYPIFLTGLSGNGKTFSVEQVCAKLKREMVRVNVTVETCLLYTSDAADE